IAAPASATGTTATAVANVTNGVVTSITVTSPGAGYGATVPAVTIAPPPAASVNAQTLQSTGITAGTPFGLAVAALDPFGNVATGYTGNVNLTLSSNPGGPSTTLNGTTSLGVANGVATFSGLSINTAASGYT